MVDQAPQNVYLRGLGRLHQDFRSTIHRITHASSNAASPLVTVGRRIATATPLHAAVGASALLLVVYCVTLAPSVTLWDSGEFLSAINTLGIPHPPATPLFVFAANAWARLFGWLPLAVAVNAGSAVATAAAAGCFAWLVSRWTGRPEAGFLGSVVGGCMATVWQSATETEVYAYALLVIALGLVVAELAGTRWSGRHRLLLSAIFGLAVPLHISVLVAGPALVMLSATDGQGNLSLRAALAPAGAWCLAVGIGTVSMLPVGIGVTILMVSVLFPLGGAGDRGRGGAIAAGLVVLLCASFVFVLLVRAQHDPAVNQGNPSTWRTMWDVVARTQYDVPPVWPRRAPLWLQIGNVVQYSDWQVASALSNAPGPSAWRTPVTLLFVALGVFGSTWHRGCDRRSWRATMLLLISATLGVVVVLNLRTGPSFGWGVLPDETVHEARERDYFFALSFMIWGVWSGCGLVALRQRWRRRGSSVVVLIASLPLLLNWRAVDRRRLPDAGLAEHIAIALLHRLPPGAVLVLAGDNDTYPVWFAQHVLNHRPDVVPVTVPLLGAGWYRAELRRRFGLLDSTTVTTWRGLAGTLAALGQGATRSGRAMSASVSVEPGERRALGGERGWSLKGMVFQRADVGTGRRITIDSAAVEESARIVERLVGGSRPELARDPTGRYVQRLLTCPRAARDRARGRPDVSSGLLESTCNLR